MACMTVQPLATARPCFARALGAGPLVGPRPSGTAQGWRIAAEKTESAPKKKVVDRPIWFPGNDPEIPDYLDGTLAGDYGFDPLGLGSEPEQLRWNVQSEVFHARTAMTAVAGILAVSILHGANPAVPQWYDAGKVYLEQNPNVSLGALIWTTIALSGFVEFKRLADWRKPGSQADQWFLGIQKEFKGKENGYPGGAFFDPLGYSRGSEAKYQEYKWKEIKNGRLALVALVGFALQYLATGKGPLDNLADHLADPWHNNFIHNGVSVPFIKTL